MFRHDSGLFISLTTTGRGCLIVLLRLAYLGASNALAMIRLLPMSDRGKDAEILAVCHQIAVLERQLGGAKVRFGLTDRALVCALLHRRRDRLGGLLHEYEHAA
jgi:hypothetical protein